MLSAAAAKSQYDCLATQIINLHASIHAASYQLLMLIREFDAAGLAQAQGFYTTAHWLSYFLGLGPNAAREKVRVARALDDLPIIDEAYAANAISYSKVRAITRVAHTGNEQRLLKYAQWATAHQVEHFVRDQVRIQKGRATVSIQPELNLMTDNDGNVVFKGRLPRELGELLVTAIQQRVDHEACFDPEAPDAERMNVRRARALVELAENALAPDAEAPQSAADRYSIHIEHDDPTLSESAITRLTCDGSVVIHESDAHGHPLNVGRKTRTIPSAIRRALRRRDKGCRYPGCTHTRFVDAHHIKHWADGGETRLDNLLLLCRRHHGVIHDGKAQVQVHLPETGAPQFRFLDQYGERILPTGDRCMASAQVTKLTPAAVARGSAVTHHEHSPFAPEHPTSNPDYRQIAYLLALSDPPGREDHPPISD